MDDGSFQVCIHHSSCGTWTPHLSTLQIVVHSCSSSIHHVVVVKSKHSYIYSGTCTSSKKASLVAELFKISVSRGTSHEGSRQNLPVLLGAFRTPKVQTLSRSWSTDGGTRPFRLQCMPREREPRSAARPAVCVLLLRRRHRLSGIHVVGAAYDGTTTNMQCFGAQTAVVGRQWLCFWLACDCGRERRGSEEGNMGSGRWAWGKYYSSADGTTSTGGRWLLLFTATTTATLCCLVDLSSARESSGTNRWCPHCRLSLKSRAVIGRAINSNS